MWRSRAHHHRYLLAQKECAHLCNSSTFCEISRVRIYIPQSYRAVTIPYWYRAVPHRFVRYCTVPYGIVLYRTVIVPYCTVLHRTVAVPCCKRTGPDRNHRNRTMLYRTGPVPKPPLIWPPKVAWSGIIHRVPREAPARRHFYNGHGVRVVTSNIFPGDKTAYKNSITVKHSNQNLIWCVKLGAYEVHVFF